jgi:hypothetical protein
MHRALTVSDVVQCIVEAVAADSGGNPGLYHEGDFSTRTCHTLYQLATVCRTLSEPVLDILWEETTPWRLGVIMPPHMFCIEITGDPNEEGIRGATTAYHLLVSLIN